MLSLAMPTYETFGKGCELLEVHFAKFLQQSYKDFEIIISDHSKDDAIRKLCESYKDRLPIRYFHNPDKRGNLSHNTNNAIKHCQGDLIKILFQDDFLWSESSLETIVNSFGDDTHWIVTACEHTYDGVNFHRTLVPAYNDEIYLGKNTIGNPSVVTFRNSEDKIFLDEGLTWMVDVDYYKKMHDRFGLPKVVPEITVVIRQWSKQLTNLIPIRIKEKEARMMMERYVKTS
jgi:glycosyltransferase involved in cell wall biosynthesis